MNKTSRIFLQPHTAVAHQENMIRSRRGFLKGIALLRYCPGRPLMLRKQEGTRC